VAAEIGTEGGWSLGCDGFESHLKSGVPYDCIVEYSASFQQPFDSAIMSSKKAFDLWVEGQKLLKILACAERHMLAEGRNVFERPAIKAKCPFPVDEESSLSRQSLQRVLKEGVEPGTNDIWPILLPVGLSARFHRSVCHYPRFCRDRGETCP
jgi:hypothetical protein